MQELESREETREGKIEKKTLHVPPGPETGVWGGGGGGISPCPEFQNWLLQEIVLLYWGLYWCHALPPLPSNEWN